MSFAQASKEELPFWLDGPEGRACAEAGGALQDIEITKLRDGVMMRFPDRAPDDALEFVGGGYDMERYPGETFESYRARLRNAYPTKRKAGSKSGVLDALAEYGFTGDAMLLQEYELTGQWPGEWYSRGRIYLGPDFGAFGIGFSPTDEQKRTIVGIILKAKSLHFQPIDIWLHWAGELISIDFTVDASIVDAGDGLRIPILPVTDYDFIVDESPIGAYLEY